jgi:hypothetical protein
VCAERISQRYFVTFPFGSVISKYIQECGLISSTRVSLAPLKVTVLLTSKVPKPWCAEATAAASMNAAKKPIRRSI